MCKCVLYYCHRMTTQLQLMNIYQYMNIATDVTMIQMYITTVIVLFQGRVKAKFVLIQAMMAQVGSIVLLIF